MFSTTNDINNKFNNMNKIIIPILMLCIGFASTVKAEDTDLSTIDNVIYVASSSTEAGETTNLSICMKNTAPIRGFQFRLYLPEGVTVVKNSKNKIQVSLTADRLDEDDDHTISASEQSDGSILVLCGSEYPEHFKGNDGEVAKLSINVSSKMPCGDYPLLLKNLKLSETDISKFYETETVESTLTITSETTSILSTKKENQTIEYYNLQGRKIESPSKGIYIIKGKTLIVR